MFKFKAKPVDQQQALTDLQALYRKQREDYEKALADLHNLKEAFIYMRIDPDKMIKWIGEPFDHTIKRILLSSVDFSEARLLTKGGTDMAGWRDMWERLKIKS